MYYDTAVQGRKSKKREKLAEADPSRSDNLEIWSLTRYQLRHSPNRLNFRAVLLKESAASSDLVKKVLFDPQRDSGSYYA